MRSKIQMLSLTLVGLMAATAVAQAPRGAGLKRDIRAWPTGDRATSVLQIERITPAEVRINEEFTYEIRVTNTSRGRIDEFSLVEQFPASFRVRSMTPDGGGAGGGQASWAMRAMEPGATQSVSVTGSTDKPDQLDWCATITFKTTACISTKIVEPRLVVEKVMPPEVTLCQDIPIRIRVMNSGSGIARNVLVTDTLPEGLATADGKTAFTFRAGDLVAGQAKEGVVSVRAARTGTFTNTCRATEEGGLSAEASATTLVRQPVLTVSKRCPEMRYVGRPIEYEITVQNNGDAPAVNTVLIDQLPNGATFVNADGGGRMAQGRITWGLGTLAPGAAQTVNVRLQANEIGMLLNRVMVRADCAEAAAECETVIKGIPAILIEVVDEPDPVEIGAQTTYTITVTNQGSSVGTNIRVECVLPDEEEFISVDGPINVPAEVTGKTIRFAPLPSLAPKARATWHVRVRGVREGDVRFKTIMISDQMSSPVEETESTNIYQ